MTSPTTWPAWRVDGLRGWGLLALRLFAAQEFLLAGWTKASAGPQAPDWFRGLDFPGPLALLGPDLNWLAAAGGELLFGSLLLLGLGTRLASLGLMFITTVAVCTVHFDLGWAGWNQIETEAGLGFKVPLMLGLLLWATLCEGPGRWALDGLLRGRRQTLGSPQA